MDYGKPILWVRNDRDSHRVVSDQHGTRFESASGSAGRVIAGVFFLVLASLPISFSIYLLSGAEETNAPEVLDECWGYQVEIQVGANPPYCLETLGNSTIISLEVSEDQHIREEIQDRERNVPHVDTYRWEEVDSSIVYGFISDGLYNCFRFIPEFNLEEDWTVDGLHGLFSYPEWCGTDYTDEEERTFEEGAHPFDGVWMYDAHETYSMTEFIERWKVEDNKLSYQLLESKAKVVSDRADRHTGDAIPSEMLCCSLPLGLLFLFAADRRRKVFVIDRSSQRITRKRAGSLPSFSTTWSHVDFNSVQLVRSVRIKEHTSGGGEDGPVRHWTTSHPGVNLVLPMEQSIQTLFFFEDGNDVSVHENVLKDLMNVMGADLDEHLLALRDEERQEQEKETRAGKTTKGATVDETEPSERLATINKGGPWGYGPIEEEIPPATVPKDDESTENAPTGSFWSFDEAGEP